MRNLLIPFCVGLAVLLAHQSPARMTGMPVQIAQGPIGPEQGGVTSRPFAPEPMQAPALIMPPLPSSKSWCERLRDIWVSNPRFFWRVPDELKEQHCDRFGITAYPVVPERQPSPGPKMNDSRSDFSGLWEEIPPFLSANGPFRLDLHQHGSRMDVRIIYPGGATGLRQAAVHGNEASWNHSWGCAEMHNKLTFDGSLLVYEVDTSWISSPFSPCDQHPTRPQIMRMRRVNQ
jgi:hypothetical protein